MATLPISGIASTASALDSSKLGAGAAASAGADFSKAITSSIQDVNQQVLQAQKISEEHLTTGKHQLHEVMIALEQADISFRYLTQIRNKVMDAYNDIMRMQV